MATLYSNLSKAGTRAGVGGGSQEVTVFSSYTVTANLALNDVIKMVTVPAGATITGITLSSTDLDSATALVYDVGDTADTDRHIAASTIGQAGGVTSTQALTGFGYTYTAATSIDVLVKTAPGTPVASGTINLAVRYVMPR